MADHKLFKVDSLVAVITGAGSGLGRMMAHALASNEAHRVYIIGRREDKLRQTAEGYNNITPVQGDVTNKDSLKAAADRIQSEAGFINALVVNGGVSGPFAALPQSREIGDLQQYLWSYSSDELNQVFATNNTGALFAMVAFLELLHAGNETKTRPDISSSLIFTASIAGFARMLATGVAYVPSKAGTIQSAKLYSTLLAKWKIRVNAIAPGVYSSEVTEKIVGNEAVLDTIPLHRTGTEEDMRGLILFLTSRARAYINGDVLITDGGRLGQAPASY